MDKIDGMRRMDYMHGLIDEMRWVDKIDRKRLMD